MDVKRLRSEIDHQTRNGRDSIYVKVSDIIELIHGAKQEVMGEERIYINMDAMNQLLSAYEKGEQAEEKAINEFKERLKVDMPDYKLTRINENGYLFQPIKDEER